MLTLAQQVAHNQAIIAANKKAANLPITNAQQLQQQVANNQRIVAAARLAAMEAENGFVLSRPGAGFSNEAEFLLYKQGKIPFAKSTDAHGFPVYARAEAMDYPHAELAAQPDYQAANAYHNNIIAPRYASTSGFDKFMGSIVVPTVKTFVAYQVGTGLLDAVTAAPATPAAGVVSPTATGGIPALGVPAPAPLSAAPVITAPEIPGLTLPGLPAGTSFGVTPAGVSSLSVAATAAPALPAAGITSPTVADAVGGVTSTVGTATTAIGAATKAAASLGLVGAVPKKATPPAPTPLPTAAKNVSVYLLAAVAVGGALLIGKWGKHGSEPAIFS